MALTTSELTLKINSTGIDKATADLKELAKAAASVDAETKAFVVSQAKLQATQGKTAAVTQEARQALIQQKRDYEVYADSVRRIEAENRLAAKAVKELAAEEAKLNAIQQKRDFEMYKQQQREVTEHNKRVANSLKETSSHGNVYVNTLRSMATAASAYVGVNFLAAIIKQADGWAMMQSKLNLAVGDMGVAVNVQKDLFNMSQRLRVPLEDTAKLFTRMSVPLQKIGYGIKDTEKVVGAFSTALKLAGATGQEASSAMLQFSQSINAGRLNGGEFNSVAEAAPNVLRAIEAELIRTGRGAELAGKGLKKMATDGKLTTEVLVNALKNAAPQWEKDFNSLPLTVDGALTRIKNAWYKAIGEIGQDTKFNEEMAKSLKKIEEVLPAIANGIATAFTFIVNNGDKILAVFAGITSAIALFKTASMIQQMMNAYTAIDTVTKAAGGLRAALLAIGITPLGIALAALGGVVAALIYNWDSLTKTVSEVNKVNDSVASSSAKIVGSIQAENLALEVQIDKLRIANDGQAKYNKTKLDGAKLNTQTELDELNRGLKVLENNLKAAEKAKQDLKDLSLFDPNKIAKTNKAKEDIEQTRQSIDMQKRMIAIYTADISNNQRLESERAEQQRSKDLREKVESIYTAARTEKQVLDATYADKIKASKDSAKKLGMDEFYLKQDLLNINKWYKDELEKINGKSGKAKEVSPEVTNLDKVNKLMAEQAALNKEWEESSKKKLSSGESFRLQVLSENEAISMLLVSGKKDNELLTAKQRLQLLNTMHVNDEAIARSKVVEAMQRGREGEQDAKKRTDELASQNESMKSQLETLQRQLETEDSLKQSKYEQNVLEADRAVQALNAQGVMGLEIALANEKLRLAKELAAVNGKLDAKKDLEDAEKFLDNMFDDTKVDKWSNSFSKGLSGIAKSFSDISKAFDKFGAKQKTISKAREEYDKIAASGTKSEIELAARKSQIDEKETEYKIASYAEMADAAKGFFAEGTRGYQTLDGVSKIFHAAQMARNLIEMGQLAIKAVMGQAQGDPYTAWGRMAAMAAVVAGLGFAVGGGFSSSNGGGAKAEDVQKTQGTGTVFGDSSAKSDSLSKSIESMTKNFDKLYPVNMGMLNSLKNIEKSLGGLTNLVFRTGITTDKMGVQEGTLSSGSKLTDFLGRIPVPVTALLGGWIGLLGSKIAGLIGNLWGKTTQNVIDSGLSLGGSLSALKQGQGVNQYASVDVTKSSWFGLKKTTTNSQLTQSVSGDISSQIAMIFSNMQTAMEEAGKALYGKSDDVTKALESLVLSTTKISLKGLSGQALSDALNAVISKGLDEMAGAAFKDFTKYQQVGEGLAQTVLRVADNFATVNSVMKQINLTMFGMSSAGIDASLKLADLMGGLENLKSAASSYYENFFTEEERNKQTLEALQSQFKGMNEELPTTIKGYRLLLEELSSKGMDDKVATMLKLSDAFAALYKSSSESLDPLQAAKDAFESLSKDAERWMNIRKQAADLKDSLDSAMGGSKKDPALRIKKLWDAMSSDISPEQKLTLANELKDLILDKYQVEKDGIQKLIDFGKQLRGYTDSLKLGNLSPLTTTQKLAEAQKQFQETLAKAQGGDTTAQQALTGKADAYLQLAQTAYASSGAYTSIFQTVTGALEALGVSSMSNEDKTIMLQQQQYDELAKLRDFASNMEVLSDSYYKTNLSLLADQTSILSKLYDKAGVFDGIASNLASLPAEIAANLSEIMKGNSSGDYITSLYNSLAGKSGTMIDKQGYDYWTNELNTYGKDWVDRSFLESVKVVTGGGVAATQVNSNAEVVTQLAGLKAELTALREESAKQTGDLITATYDANNANASTIVEGTTTSLQQGAWAATTTPTLI